MGKVKVKCTENLPGLYQFVTLPQVMKPFLSSLS